MTEKQEIIKLILNDKKKSNTYDRYPIRFLFMKLSQNSEEELIDTTETDDSLCQVDGDRVHTYNTEYQCPLLPALNIYNIVEDSHHSQ